MKALSIHQPWAWAILNAGKVVENRTWPTSYRGPLLIHASKSRASHDAQRLLDWPRLYGVALPPWEELAAGVLLGVVDLVDCQRAEWKAEAIKRDGGRSVTIERPHVQGVGFTGWAEPGYWCWVLRNPRPLVEPIPYRGMQSLFEVADDILPAEFRPRPSVGHHQVEPGR